ncbi:MAG: ABC transporter ATP-binding protein [Firmicutes bacterium]|nr:ABC transporter ATP-binding protein [Bacillota bacterium]
MVQALLTVENLHTEFRRAEDVIYAVNGVSFTVAPGETLGIVGESGSGKSVSVLSVLGLLRGTGRVTQGTARFGSTDLLKLKRRQLEDIRGRDIGVIFQDPMTSLNPTMRIGDQIMEAMLTHHFVGRKAAYNRSIELLEEVGIPDPQTRFRNYPFEFSGGMRQRVMIAMAVACEPQLLIADEPTTALDVTVQMQVLSLLQKLRETRRMSVVIITHDFGVATNFCDRIMVMYAGKVMESAPLEEFLKRPAHPYSVGLKSSIIEVGQTNRVLLPIPGTTQQLTEPPRSCPFVDRCTMAQDACRETLPQLRQLGGADHWVACLRAEEVVRHAG